MPARYVEWASDFINMFVLGKVNLILLYPKPD